MTIETTRPIHTLQASRRSCDLDTIARGVTQFDQLITALPGVYLSVALEPSDALYYESRSLGGSLCMPCNT